MTAPATCPNCGALPAKVEVTDLPHLCACLPVGEKQIAENLGVSRKTPNTWRVRGVLPREDWYIGRDPAWCWEHTIKPWARRTGRLKAPDADARIREHQGVPVAIRYVTPEEADYPRLLDG